MRDAATIWPALSCAGWRDTAATLHLGTQIVGKVRLALTPWVNHSWQVPLYLSARGARDLAVRDLRRSSWCGRGRGCK